MGGKLTLTAARAVGHHHVNPNTQRADESRRDQHKKRERHVHAGPIWRSLIGNSILQEAPPQPERERDASEPWKQARRTSVGQPQKWCGCQHASDDESIWLRKIG